MPSTSVLSNAQKVGYGLMNWTWVASRKFTQEQFNTVFKEVIDASGASSAHQLFVNGGEFYGIPERHENLKLIGTFFESYPAYADKIYLSIKGGVNDHWGPDNSQENITRGLDAIEKNLAPLYAARKEKPKTLDMYTLARIGTEPVEETVKFLHSESKAGKFTSLCLSEVNANTLAKALAVAPIAAVELEFSLFHRESIENGVLAKCREQGIPVVAYSPLGKGLLVGHTVDDLAADDNRRHFDKFNDPENVKHNQVLVDKVAEIAKGLGVTPAQVSISWITSLSGTSHGGFDYPQIVPIPGSTNAERQKNNQSVVTLSGETLAEIDGVLSSFKTAGHRYNEVIDSAGYK